MGSYSLVPLQAESKTMILPTTSGVGIKGCFPLGRQSSIYSLTLDEFQNALGEPGRSFGSMNMDEFLKSIWTTEESQAIAAALVGAEGTGGSQGGQQSLERQGSLSLPRTLSRKTVDEVWNNINREGLDACPDAASGQQRQATFGEMTLEDFLVKAGVVTQEIDPEGQSFIPVGAGLESDFGAGGADRSGDQLKIDNGLDVSVGEHKGGHEEKVWGGTLPALSLSPAIALSGQGTINPVHLEALKHVSPGLQPTDWLTNQYGNAMAQQQQHHIFQQKTATAAAYANVAKSNGNGAIVGPGRNGMGMLGHIGGGLEGGMGVGKSGGFNTNLRPTAVGLGTGSPCRPASNGVGPRHVDVSALSLVPYGLDGPLCGRKRGLEGPVENVVERRHKRMIKNRESAARSRARKQAYTVELEAEISQLKEENTILRKQQGEMAEKRKRQVLEMVAPLVQQLAPRTRVLRRTRTGPW